MMRAQKDGIIIITASMAGRNMGLLSGAAYVAAKHGVVAMSHSINMAECINGIRCTAVLPGEVATPILDKRPVPVSAEDRARMVQSEDVGDLIRYIACLPPHVCLNEVWITPDLEPRLRRRPAAPSASTVIPANTGFQFLAGTAMHRTVYFVIVTKWARDHPRP